MKRICVDIQSVLKMRTGIGWYTYETSKRIAEFNRDFEVFGLAFDFMNRNSSKDISNDLDFDKVEIFTKVPARIYKLLWNLIPIKYDSIFSAGDVYHFNNYIVPPMGNKSKVIINIYDMVYKQYPNTMKKSNLYFLNRDIARSANRADIIITISESSKKDIIKFLNVSKSKIRIIPPGVDSEFFQKGLNPSNEIKRSMIERYNLPTDYFLYLGTLEPRKNIITVLKAYSKLARDIKKKYKLVLCGSKGWKYKDIFDEIDRLGIAENILFTGYVDEIDKPFIYGMARVFLFPSLYEGFGIPIVESMASGVPVITSNTASMPEAGGKAAIYIEPNDYLSMAKNIEKLVLDEDFHSEKKKESILQAGNFSWSKAAIQTMEVYKELLS